MNAIQRVDDVLYTRIMDDSTNRSVDRAWPSDSQPHAL